MPRAIWSGTIAFGLVSVPVRMFSAISERKLHFHYVHEPDAGRIGYEKVCKAEGKLVPDDEIVKAYEWKPGEFVYMSDEDFEAAQIEGHRSFEISDFVPAEQIDPIFFERTYYLAPQDGAERVYSLLVQAMERAGLVAVGKYVMRERQHLGALRVRDGVLALERMYFEDEIREASEVAPGKAKVDKRELDMALQLIDRFTGDFEPGKYEDTYRETLHEIIKAKRKGKEVAVAAPEPEEEPADLMEALRASLDSVKGGRRPARRSGPQRRPARRSGRDGDLSRLSKQELLERAKKADVKGRSEMTKEELVEALENVAA